MPVYLLKRIFNCGGSASFKSSHYSILVVEIRILFQTEVVTRYGPIHRGKERGEVLKNDILTSCYVNKQRVT